MPYVDDNKYEPEMVELFYHYAGGTPVSRGVHPKSYVLANQYGWRSIGESEAAHAALESLQGSTTWKDTFTVIEAFDRIERATSNPLIRSPYDDTVNDRDFTERTSNGKVVQSTVGDPGNPFHFADNLFVTYLTGDFPSLPTENTQRVEGAEILRSARPTRPHSNLTQWFGELRQFGDLTNVTTKIRPQDLNTPGFRGEVERFRQGGAAVGGAYLAGQFGWVPFFGELLNALEVCANSDALINQFVRDSGKLVRRSRERVLKQEVYTGNGTLNGASSYNHRTLNYDGIGVQVGWRPGYMSSRLSTTFESTVTVTDKLRAGATWEYFVADPNGSLGRIREFNQRAKLLLGDPLLSYSTLWELAPWSWLVDWHTDIGGLLSFQESVAEDSLVARRAYTSVLRDIDVVTRHDNYHYNTTGTWVGDAPIAHSTASLRQVRRRQGSPYDMGIDWTGYTTQQWFILGALGLTNAPGIPR